MLAFIAKVISSNIRELEGSLIRVVAFAWLDRQGVDLAFAKIVITACSRTTRSRDHLEHIMARRRLLRAVAGGPLSTCHNRVLVQARQVAMYLCSELTDLPSPSSAAFGSRDHTTVMRAVRKIRTLMSERRSTYNQVTELTNRIRNQSR